MRRKSTNPMLSIFRQRKLLFNTVKADVKIQYAGTVLGVGWVVLGPVLLLFLYSMIYAVIFRVRIPNFTVEEYILNVFSGLVPFLAFAQALSFSASSVRRDRKLFFSNFPVEFIPIKAVAVSYVMLLIGTVIVVLGDFVASEPSWTLLLVPVVAIFQFIFSVGIGMYLSLLALAVKDIEILIQYIVIALLVVTPIAYTPDMIPDGMKPLLYTNPLFYFVYANQHLILLNKLPPVEIWAVGVFVSIFTFVSGLWFFSRARKVVNDLM